MYPEPTQQPYSQPPQITNPSSYLDQIAPPTVKKFTFMKKKPILIGIISVFVLIIYLIISNLPKPVTLSESLGARLMYTSQIASDANVKIRSAKLRSINTNLKTYLLNTTRDIKPFLLQEKIVYGVFSSGAIAAETSAPVLLALEDARLNAVYDRAYSSEMSYRLSTVLTLMDQVSNNTNNAGYRQFLANAKKNLEPIQVEFAIFYEKNS